MQHTDPITYTNAARKHSHASSHSLHTVRITARDPDGCEEADSVLVCLDAPEICN